MKQIMLDETQLCADEQRKVLHNMTKYVFVGGWVSCLLFLFSYSISSYKLLGSTNDWVLQKQKSSGEEVSGHTSLGVSL